jgi:hypothetical protein
MTQKELLSEKWKVHKWVGTERVSYYIGPVHGRVAVSSYKTLAAAKAALEMRLWIAKELGPTRKQTTK